jgi:hypothetical protein
LRFLRTALSAQATIVAVRVDGVGRNAVTVPTFEFKTADGSVQRAESLQPSGFAGASVGRTLAIRYDPAQPSRADLDTFGALWGLALLHAAFGGLFVAMGLAAILLTALRS